MPSLSKAKFDAIFARSSLLTAQASKLKTKIDRPAKVVFLHAALATQVAAWEVYVKAVTSEYFTVSARHTDPAFMAMHMLLQQKMMQATKKLNTPNSDNCRDFMMEYAGFDPWSHWVDVRFGNTKFTNSLLTRNRLNEIFTVRHSFAHGLTMPAHSWNNNSGGVAHLDCSILKKTATFFHDLCNKTDIAFSKHIAQQHLIAKPW